MRGTLDEEATDQTVRSRRAGREEPKPAFFPERRPDPLNGSHPLRASAGGARPQTAPGDSSSEAIRAT